MDNLAPHGGCWWEGCKICNTPTNPYPLSWRPQAKEEPTICHICGKTGANIPDPCCGAPDCENLTDWAHFDCLPQWRQQEERQ